MTPAAPPIDTRTAADLAAAIEDRLRRYAGWQPQAALPVPDPGYALSRIVARFMEIGIDRLNRAPDKALLAFLDLLGLELLPPQAARAPLTFTLATGAQADARVPAGTRVAAQPLPGDPGRSCSRPSGTCWSTRSSLVAVLSREPGRDRYADHATLVAPGRVDPVRVFAGDRPIRHRLYLGHEALLATDAAKTVTLTIAPADPDTGWPYRLAWGWWDGAAVAGLSAAVTSTGSAWQVRLDTVPAVPEAAIAGRSSRWLVADLTAPLPHDDPLPPAASGPTVLARAGIAPDAAWRDAGAAGLAAARPRPPLLPPRRQRPGHGVPAGERAGVRQAGCGRHPRGRDRPRGAGPADPGPAAGVGVLGRRRLAAARHLDPELRSPSPAARAASPTAPWRSRPRASSPSAAPPPGRQARRAEFLATGCGCASRPAASPGRRCRRRA